MLKIILALLMLVITNSEAQLLTYLFPEDKDITICPAITSEFSATPSFRLEPTSATLNDQFLVGIYIEPADGGIQGAQFVQEDGPCEDNSTVTCSKLSLIYPLDVPVGRGTFPITYNASNGVIRNILIDYGYVGLYLEEASLVLGRDPVVVAALNDSVVAYGAIFQLFFCYENGTAASDTIVRFVPDPFDDVSCSLDTVNEQPNSQPGRFKIILLNNVTGQERAYFADGDCSSSRRSQEFLVIFDVSSTEGPDPTTEPTNPTSFGLLGLALGCVVGVLVIMTGLLLLSVIRFLWYRKRHGKKHIYHIDTMHMVHHVAVPSRRSPVIELHGIYNEGQPLVPKPPLPPSSRRLYIVPSIDHENVKQLKQELYDCFSNLHPAPLPSEIGNFDHSLMQIVEKQHTVIILGDIGEISDRSRGISSGRKWLTSLLSSPAFHKEQLRHVFYVRFGTDTVTAGYMEKLQQILVSEHPNDNNFDPAYVAKLIHERIVEGEEPIGLTLGERAREEQLPLQSRSSTSDLGSEVSESSLKGEETVYSRVTDTYETESQVYPSLLVRLNTSPHASVTFGGLELVSATSVRTTGHGREDGEAQRENREVEVSDEAATNTELMPDPSMTSIAFMEEEGIVNEAVQTAGESIKMGRGAVKTVGETVGGGITPTNLEYVANCKGDNMMQLTWQLPEHAERVFQFQIEYKHLLDPSMFLYQVDHVYIEHKPHFYHVDGNELKSFVNDLCPGYQYQFRIRSANATGWGMWSKPVTGRCGDFPVTISYTKKINRIRIPMNGYYRITAKGAKAADGKMHCGGKGAVITATFHLKAGDVLIILCGGMSSLLIQNTGGGGGTFIAVNEINHENLLIVAGGGGGTRGMNENDFDGCDASLEPNGTDGQGREHGKGGVHGYAGEDAKPDNYQPCWGYGGAGFFQDSTTALSFLKGGRGGPCGGFGGGGGIGQYGGGGGGGYSGGGGGRGGGGGGSYIRDDGIHIKKALGDQSNGSVTVENVPYPYPHQVSGSHSSQYNERPDEQHIRRTPRSTDFSATNAEADSDNISSGSSIQVQSPHLSLVSTEGEKSIQFRKATEEAQVLFTRHYIWECDNRCVEYTIKDHDITLRIPEGTVPAGKNVIFEIAVAMYGPFLFPESSRPISPIVWLCILEDTELKKPFQLTLPHFLTGLKKERLNYHEVNFAKANHDSVNVENKYIFNHCDSLPLFAATEYRSYGVLKSTHCCFYCLLAKNSPELARDAGYCLARIETVLSPRRNEVYFAAIFFLDTCIRALEEQFPHENGYRICRYNPFKFDAEELDIVIIAPCEPDQCVITLEPTTAKIRAADIDFWNFEFSIIKLQHEKNIYPPRVKMTVVMRAQNCVLKIPIKIKGCSCHNQLDVELAFPLLDIPRLSSSTSSSSGPLEPQSQTIAAMGDKPKLRNVFKRLLPLAKDWKTIGGLLGVERHILDNIKRDEEGVRDCLHAMLSEWLKQVDPPPTWTNMVDAVEVVDSSKAEEIRKHLAC